MLKVAVPNKGSLSESAAQLLAEAGYRQRRSARDLVTVDADNDVEFFYLRPRDIAIYVGEGTLDIGITGRDLLLDSGAAADEVMALGFGASSFHFAAPVGSLADTAAIAGRPSPPRTQAWSAHGSPSAGSTPRSSASTAPWSRRSASASPT